MIERMSMMGECLASFDNNLLTNDEFCNVVLRRVTYSLDNLSSKRLEGLLKECNKLVDTYDNQGRLLGTKNKLILSIINSLDFRFRHDRFIYYSISVIILSKIDNS